MSRRARHDSPVDWHVFNRGSRRMALFRDDLDAAVFLHLLKSALRVSGCALWAYLLMSNHFHMALRGTSRQLQRCMQGLERQYATYHNRRYGLSGAAFEGRYEAYPQGTLPMLLRTVSYIFMNPVAAGMVSTPDAYAWSNYGSYFSGETGPLSGEVDLLLGRMEGDPSLVLAKLRLYTDREVSRIRRGEHRPGLSARDVQANHFDWLLEEAKARTPALETFDALTLALHWAQTAGFHRSALMKVVGGPLSTRQRSELSRFRRWIKAEPSRQVLTALP